MTTFPKATIEGYPRIGANRELKHALESYWAGRIDADTFRSTARALRVNNYNHLRDLGLTEDYAIPADVALYDQVLETALTVGLVPGGVDLDEEFALARGNATRVPLEMTKWFDTNYHYLVPEIEAGQEIKAVPERILHIVEEAAEAGHKVRPFLVGPVTLIALSKPAEWSLLPALVDAYAEVFKALKDTGVEWIQIAEPAVVADLSTPDAEIAKYLREAWSDLLGREDRPNVYLTTPYGSAREALPVLGELGVEALHVDLAPWTLEADADYPERIRTTIPETTHLVAGIIDGRNVWAANLRERTEVLESLGRPVSISTSTSLQHVPHTLKAERNLPVEVAPWLSFADEKLAEIQALVAGPEAAAEAFAQSDRAVRTRAESTTIHNQAVVDRVAALPEGEVKREPAFEERIKIQREELKLPTLPITTIGSFPQTQEIRKARADHREGSLSDADYKEALKTEIKQVIELQEEIGLDVLVHGEAERNDMVQYFAELLDGFVVTENGWVQSYGSRCTRPPIVVGDVSRPKALSVDWSAYAQSLSDKPVKGISPAR